MMIKEIVTDVSFLKQKSSPATKQDNQVVLDLKETLVANRERCVGLAANMIGVKKRILVYATGPFYVALINPIIVSKSGAYTTTESCLSLEGERETIRYETIEVTYLNEQFVKQRATFNGFIAQIIQHEMDHFNGIII